MHCRINRRLLPSQVKLQADVVREQRRWLASHADYQQWKARHGGVDLLVCVTTYERPQACRRLLKTLARFQAKVPAKSIAIAVIDDGSSSDICDILRTASSDWGERLIVMKHERNFGKQRFWITYQQLFTIAEEVKPAQTAFLQDDVELDVARFAQTLKQWEAWQDPKKSVLYLFRSESDETHGRWIRYASHIVGDGIFLLTQWFDLQAFVVDKRFFDLLDYQVFPVSRRRWRWRTSLSSGVGRQLTMRLFSRGNVYQVREPVAFHGGERSQMNPEARRLDPLDNRHWRDFDTVPVESQ